MKTLEQIINNRTENFEKIKETLMNSGDEDSANEVQIHLNLLSGILSEYKSQKCSHSEEKMV